MEVYIFGRPFKKLHFNEEIEAYCDLTKLKNTLTGHPNVIRLRKHNWATAYHVPGWRTPNQSTDLKRQSRVPQIG